MRDFLGDDQTIVPASILSTQGKCYYSNYDKKERIFMLPSILDRRSILPEKFVNDENEIVDVKLVLFKMMSILEFTYPGSFSVTRNLIFNVKILRETLTVGEYGSIKRGELKKLIRFIYTSVDNKDPKGLVMGKGSSSFDGFVVIPLHTEMGIYVFIFTIQSKYSAQGINTINDIFEEIRKLGIINKFGNEKVLMELLKEHYKKVGEEFNIIGIEMRSILFCDALKLGKRNYESTVKGCRDAFKVFRNLNSVKHKDRKKKEKFAASEAVRKWRDVYARNFTGEDIAGMCWNRCFSLVFQYHDNDNIVPHLFRSLKILNMKKSKNPSYVAPKKEEIFVKNIGNVFGSITGEWKKNMTREEADRKKIIFVSKKRKRKEDDDGEKEHPSKIQKAEENK